MKFTRYSSIENHYRKKYIEILEEHNFADIPYIAHEKIHGCNFSFWTDGNEVRVASRGSFVDGTFYACQSVIDRYAGNILHLKDEYLNKAEQIAVYGELYGPGIMKGVFYSERKDFRAFDIKVDGEFLPQMRAKLLLAQCDIPQVPYVDLYDNVYDAVAANNIFTSKVSVMDAERDAPDPGLIKFCEYKAGENDAEGMVIQPLHDVLYTGNGARVMIKNKNPKFAEKSKAKEHKEHVPNPFVPIAEMYVNQNRLDAVMSKFGNATQKDFGKIIGLMNKDVIEDMIRDDDLPEDWKKHDEFKLAGKGVGTAVSAFLKEHLLPGL
ncbi:MAG: hypothetical protein DRQ47_04490 [Gammaproteobacteria bacterium]|nr:MAG: hypothetical protein DRQ47_04490 [Gammaproteobacteria bacterium]